MAGASAARRMVERGWDVTVVEDRPTDASRARAEGLDVVWAPPSHDMLVDECDVLVPSPGVPIGHPAIQRALAGGTTVWTEFELAARWSTIPMVAITGTNGKTTVTTLVDDMLRASGLRSVAAGNTDVPLVDAIADESLDVVVVEASSFRLEFTETFHPKVAVWLNLAEDHLDWHPSMDAYAAAKARIWANQGSGDLAVANAEDPVVLAHLPSGPRVETFGLAAGDWHVDGDRLVRPDGSVLVTTDRLWRSLPHDCANALAASAAALGMGATEAGVREALAAFRGLPHRLELVGDDGAVRFYDDSKATDPHAAAVALRAFESSVLIAGGRNKGLDLSVLVAEADRVRAVVAIGEAGPDVARAFSEAGTEVTSAASMDEAVATARSLAEPGDVVLLSPGCASFDWYANYNARGDDFARAVRELLDGAP